MKDNNYLPDVWLDGIMRGRNIFITGMGSHGSYFNVGGRTMMSYDLKVRGYKVSVRSGCFATINRTPVTCAPPDYWGEEYYPCDPERGTRKKKKTTEKPKRKKKDTEEKSES